MAIDLLGLALTRLRPVVREAALHRRLHEPEVRDCGTQLFQALLAIDDLGIEKIVMMAIKRFAMQILVIAVTYGNGSPSHYVIDTTA
jgi:hypothetical protein